jgi:tetratricopeptide (TPR) repeat protein
LLSTRSGRYLLVFLGLALCICGCGPSKPAVVPQQNLGVIQRLAVAERLLWQGCFSCLIDALHEYEEIRRLPIQPDNIGDAATVGWIRATLLIELRGRELGIVHNGYLQLAREAIQARADLHHVFGPTIEAVAAMPSAVVRFEDVDVGARRRAEAFRETVKPLLAEWRQHADDDPLSAYSWVAFTCTFGDFENRTPDILLAAFSERRAAGLVTYRIAICRGTDASSMEDLLKREARFVEANYWLGSHAVSELRLEEAEPFFRRAYDWQASWPTLTLALGNLYFAFEESERALDFYEQTLALSAGLPEALIGRVKALSLLRRHTEALSATEPMVGGAVRILPGEAFYWRAWNSLQLEHLEPAWADIELASSLSRNSEVSKLGGIIAYARREIDIARQRFELARKLNPGDCETIYYLGMTRVDQREWIASVDIFAGAVACLESGRHSLQSEIDAIGQSSIADDRKMRQIARRERQIAAADRMMATAFFNTAVAYFNLSRFDEARSFATRVAEDAQFAERARELLKRLVRTRP